MAETRTPIDPLERQDIVGIRDGSDQAREPVADTRHGPGRPAPHGPAEARTTPPAEDDRPQG